VSEYPWRRIGRTDYVLIERCGSAPKGFVFQVSVPRCLEWLISPHDPEWLWIARRHDTRLHLHVGMGIGFGGQVLSPAPLALDNLTSAAAYSTRRLRTAYAGPLVRVRRSSDNAEADIGYGADGWLDEAALLAHVGAGDGFVTTWYDQSGNGRDATQTTAATRHSRRQKNPKSPRISALRITPMLNGF
jgi:hypothetical protein